MTLWPFRTSNDNEDSENMIQKVVSKYLKKAVGHGVIPLSLVSLDHQSIFEIRRHPVRQAVAKTKRLFIKICAGFLAHKVLRKINRFETGIYTLVIRWKYLKRAFKIAEWATGNNLLIFLHEIVYQCAC
jgi:hypothetical protein